MAYTFSFTIQVDPECWEGTPSPFELRLLRPLPVYALEQLRTRFLHAVTTASVPAKAARVILQMAFETEIGTMLAKLITVAPDVFPSRICERRRYMDIDADMQLFKFLWAPALTALREHSDIPSNYIELIERHLDAGYPRYRTVALAAMLCMATTYLVEAA